MSQVKGWPRRSDKYVDYSHGYNKCDGMITADAMLFQLKYYTR